MEKMKTVRQIQIEYLEALTENGTVEIDEATEPTMPKIYKWNKGKYTLLQWAKMEKNYNLFVW